MALKLTYCLYTLAGLHKLVLLHDGWIVNILAENVTQALQALDLALHVLSVLLLDRDRARVLYLDLEHLELRDTLYRQAQK